MNTVLHSHAQRIMQESIREVLPDSAVKKALAQYVPGKGKTILVAAGKAAWQMASAALQILKHVDCGIVITKYGHCKSELPGIVCAEAGHPVPDENGFAATQKALAMVSGLTAEDRVIFLLSGGGSALFEKPLISGSELQKLTGDLLSCGASITEINTIRKRLSGVKGGRFALACAPAKVFAVALSDVLGDRADVIASGPVSPDMTTCKEAEEIVRKYGLTVSAQVQALLQQETPKTLDNVEMKITGSVRLLCAAAQKACQSLGYETEVLTDGLCCEAREAGAWIASLVKQRLSGRKTPLALIAGGEAVVHLTGNGLGGRNQELALSATQKISGLPCAVFSFGSDGTDGPTDAAGGYVDGDTADELRSCGVDMEAALKNNDSYHALKKIGGLLMTGPTGTNVNDVSIALICPKA